MSSTYPAVGEAINSILQFQMDMTKMLMDAFSEINILKSSEHYSKSMTFDKENLENAKGLVQGYGILSDPSSPRNLPIAK